MKHYLSRAFFALALLCAAPADAQNARVVASCGTLANPYTLGALRELTVDTLGNLCGGIVGSGNTATVSTDGALNVQTPFYPQFTDAFSVALDTTTNWTANNSTGTASTSTGNLTVASSTTASAWGGITTKQSWSPAGTSPQVFGIAATFATPTIANSTRVFGVFTVPGTPTTAVPATDGYLFRLDGTGSLFAEVWASGVAVSSTNVTAACPPAAQINVYYFVFRGNLVNFGCGITQNVAVAQGINPNNQTLPISIFSIAGSTPPGVSATATYSSLSLATGSPPTLKTAGQAPTINDPALVTTQSPNSASPAPSTLFPYGATAISGNASGSTGAVVGTLAAAAAKTTFICGFNAQAIGGTATVGPITIAGLIGSSQVYQGSSTATGGSVASATFLPCIPASAVNTAITITTTADLTATAVNVNSWGYQQ